MPIVLFSWVLFFHSLLQAEGNQCLSGSPSNKTYIRAIQNASTPLVADFRASSVFKPTTEGRLGCVGGNCSNFVSSILSLPRTLAEIPKDCIHASMRRQVAQTSIECQRQPDGNWHYIRRAARSKSTPCIDSSTVDYVHHVTNKVMSCFQGLNLGNGVSESLDAKLLYSKINNESAFNFSYSYNGGTGAGQLTSSAVREMNVSDEKGTPGRGRFILDAVLNSSKPECQGLKHIIADDRRFKYRDPRDSKRICEWTSMETGLAKSLIYSIGYFSFLKHEAIGKQLKRIAPHAYKDPEILNMLAMVAYGPGGASRARSLIYMHKMNVQAVSLDHIKKQLRNDKYLAATAGKLGEVKRMSGASCRLL